MFSRVRIAIRFFFVGLAVGILMAPRRGEETRRLLRDRADRLLNDILDAATLGTIETTGGTPATTADEPATTGRSRSGNGSRTRSTTRTSESTTAASEAGV